MVDQGERLALSPKRRRFETLNSRLLGRVSAAANPVSKGGRDGEGDDDALWILCRIAQWSHEDEKV